MVFEIKKSIGTRWTFFILSVKPYFLPFLTVVFLTVALLTAAF